MLNTHVQVVAEALVTVGGGAEAHLADVEVTVVGAAAVEAVEGRALVPRVERR